MSGPRQRRKRRELPLEALGDLVTERRVNLQLTQRELADLADVGQSTVHSIEHGSDRTTLAVLLRVLDVLGVSLLTETRDGIGRTHTAHLSKTDAP